MKKAKQIIYEHYGCKSWKELCEYLGTEVSPIMIEECVKIAQEDAIRETVKECAENAKILRTESEILKDMLGHARKFRMVDKQSILSVADKLIKEL